MAVGHTPGILVYLEDTIKEAMYGVTQVELGMTVGVKPDPHTLITQHTIYVVKTVVEHVLILILEDTADPALKTMFVQHGIRVLHGILGIMKEAMYGVIMPHGFHVQVAGLPLSLLQILKGRYT